MKTNVSISVLGLFSMTLVLHKNRINFNTVVMGQSLSVHFSKKVGIAFRFSVFGVRGLFIRTPSATTVEFKM